MNISRVSRRRGIIHVASKTEYVKRQSPDCIGSAFRADKQHIGGVALSSTNKSLPQSVDSSTYSDSSFFTESPFIDLDDLTADEFYLMGFYRKWLSLYNSPCNLSIKDTGLCIKWEEQKTRRIRSCLVSKGLIQLNDQPGRPCIVTIVDRAQDNQQRYADSKPNSRVPRLIKPRKRNHSREYMARHHDRIFTLIGKRDGFHCAKCKATENLHIDHVKPLSLGGDNDLGNLQLLCAICNVAKGAKEADYRMNGGAK